MLELLNEDTDTLVRGILLDSLVEEDPEDVNLENVRDQTFNRDYFEGYTDALEFIEEQECVFDVIAEVLQYEKENFGECCSPLEVCATANMILYIAGNEVMSEYPQLYEDNMSKEELEELISDLTEELGLK